MRGAGVGGPPHPYVSGVRLRARLARGSLRGQSQGYWIGQPATPGLYGAVGLLYVP